jgi:hypothetical protein
LAASMGLTYILVNWLVGDRHFLQLLRKVKSR